MSYKMRLFRFVKSREIYRDEINCPRPIKARYRGRAVFIVED